MARIVRKKENTLATPSDNIGRLKSAAVLKVKETGEVDDTSIALGTFLLNPASIEDSKSSNWNEQSIPGQSHPIYQWVSGGARTISFEALVTKDTFHAGQKKTSSLESQLSSAALNVAGDIASAFAGVSLPPVTDLFGTEPTRGTIISIESQLNYYRTLLAPKYEEGFSGLRTSPPLVVLLFGKSLSPTNTADGPISPANNPDTAYTPVWMVTNLNIRITKQLPNLDPMEAFVGFTLKEYAITPISMGNIISSSFSEEPILDNFGI